MPRANRLDEVMKLVSRKRRIYPLWVDERDTPADIEAKRKRVDALAQAISMIRPVLDRFADTLNDEQKIRLVKILSSTQMTVPAAPTAPRRRSDDDD